MVVTAVLLGLAAAVVIGTALALAGRWQPEGLAPLPLPAAPDRTDRGPRFEVVLRGYRMDQVDQELARLHRLLAAYEQAGEPEQMPRPGEGPTIGG